MDAVAIAKEHSKALSKERTKTLEALSRARAAEAALKALPVAVDRAERAEAA